MENDLRKANRGDWLELWGALCVLLKKGIRDKYQGWKKLIRMRRGDQIFENKWEELYKKELCFLERRM
jgi:hypothetical protein